LNFAHPFLAENSFISVSEDRLFLRVLLECIYAIPVVILDYQLQLNEQDQFKVVGDPNSFIKNSILNPHQTVSFVFELARVNEMASHMEFTVQYKFTKGDKDISTQSEQLQLISAPSKMVFTSNINTLPLTPDYKITVECADQGIKGVLIPFHFSITKLSEKESDKFNYYQLEADPNLWLIFGKRLGRFLLTKADKKQKFKCMLVPLVSGILELPKVKITNYDPNSIKCDQKYKLIHILPQSQVISSCCKV